MILYNCKLVDVDKKNVIEGSIEIRNGIIKKIDSDIEKKDGDESINLNYELLKKPFIKNNKTINLNYDIPSYYENALLGKEFKIKKEKTSYTIQSFKEKPHDFSEWAQKVIWYGHRRAAYFYDYKKTSVRLRLESF